MIPPPPTHLNKHGQLGGGLEPPHKLPRQGGVYELGEGAAKGRPLLTLFLQQGGGNPLKYGYLGILGSMSLVKGRLKADRSSRSSCSKARGNASLTRAPYTSFGMCGMGVRKLWFCTFICSGGPGAQYLVQHLRQAHRAHLHPALPAYSSTSLVLTSHHNKYFTVCLPCAIYSCSCCQQRQRIQLGRFQKGGEGQRYAA